MGYYDDLFLKHPNLQVELLIVLFFLCQLAIIGLGIEIYMYKKIILNGMLLCLMVVFILPIFINLNIEYLTHLNGGLILNLVINTIAALACGVLISKEVSWWQLPAAIDLIIFMGYALIASNSNYNFGVFIGLYSLVGYTSKALISLYQEIKNINAE